MTPFSASPIRLAAEHECAHIRAAQYFGVPVTRAEVHADASGRIDVAHRPIDDDELFRSAVIAAVGVEFDRLRGVPADRTAGDQYLVDRFRAAFLERTGREMDDPHHAARTLLTYGFVFGDAFDRLAAALEAARVLTGEQIEALTRGIDQETAAVQRAAETHYRLSGQQARVCVGGEWILWPPHPQPEAPR